MLEKIKKMNEKNKKRLYFFIYTFFMVFMFFIMYSIFFIKGKSFIWQEDGLQQHYIAFRYYGAWLRTCISNIFVNHSFEIPMWDFSIGQGADIISTLHYYVIGDPISLLSVFAGKNNSELLYNILIFLRMYLAGLAFSLFCFKFDFNKKGILIGALSYIFCGYTITAAIRHPYFINPMIYLPLILLGAEKILRAEKPYLFIFMIFISGISNFYFLYTLVIMTIIYVLVRYFTLNKEKNFKNFINTILKFALYGIIGILMSMFILLPVIKLFLSDVRIDANNEVNLFYDIKYYYTVLMSFGNYAEAGNWTYLGYTPISLICIYAIFTKRKKEDNTLKILFIILTVFVSFPIFGHILNGMSYVSNRWIWAYSLLVCMMIAKSFEYIFELDTKEKIILVIFGIIYIVLYILGDIYNLDRNRSKIITITFAISMLMYLAILGIRNNKFIKIKQFALFILILIGITGNAIYKFNFYKGGYVKQFIDIGESNKQLNNAPASVLKEMEDNTFYRYAELSSNNFIFNTAMLHDVNNIGYYFSLQNGNIARYLLEMNNLEYRTNFRYKTVDERTVLNELASVKYYVVTNNKKSVPYGYKLAKEIKKNDRVYKIYENEIYLPIGYLYEGYITRDYYDKLNAVEKQEALLQSVLLEEEITEYKKQEPILECEKIDYKITEKDEEIITEANKFIVTKENTRMILEFDGKENSETYLQFLGMNYQRLNKEQVAKQAQKEKSNKKVYKDKRLTKSNEKNKKPQMKSFYKQIRIETQDANKFFIFNTPDYQFYNGRKNFVINLGYSKEKKDYIILTFYKKRYIYF